MKPIRPWTVQQHGALTKRDDGLWTVDDDVPGLKGAGRRMGIVKRDNGALLFFNAIPVSDAVLAEIHGLGRPAQLVVPNHFHSLDAAALVEKLGVTAYAPAPAVEVLKDRVRCQPISALPADSSLQTFTVDGFATHEVAVVTRGTLLVGDLVTNVPHGGGMNGLLMRLVGFTGPKPRLPWSVQKRVGKANHPHPRSHHRSRCAGRAARGRGDAQGEVMPRVKPRLFAVSETLSQTAR